MEAAPLAGNVFNADNYLALNSDISHSGWDALAHYIEHGVKENRNF